MSKVLYPKQKEKKAVVKETDPYVIVFHDNPEGLLDEVRTYSSETSAKLSAWYHCKVLGFYPHAVLYSRDEWEAMGRA